MNEDNENNIIDNNTEMIDNNNSNIDDNIFDTIENSKSTNNLLNSPNPSPFQNPYPYQNPPSSFNSSPKIDHISYCLKGDFMPSAILISEGKITANEIIEKEEGFSILHMAVIKGYLNVTRFLISYSADVNIKNNKGRTPLHEICSSGENEENKAVFAELVRIKNILLDEEDDNGLTPLLESVRSGFNSAFYCLVAMGADISHTDKSRNGVIFYCLKYNNIQALRFALSHSDRNAGMPRELTRVLATSVGRDCCKFIVGEKGEEFGELITRPEPISSYLSNELNMFNYELLWTVYHIINDNIFKNIYYLFTEKYRHKYLLYNIFYILKYYTVNHYFSETFVRFLAFFYSILISLTFCILYIKFNGIDIFSPRILFDLYEMSNLPLLLYGFFKLYISSPPEKIKNFYVEKKRIDEEDNLIGLTKKAYQENLIDLYQEGEDCPVCLLKKNMLIQHCDVCDKCVRKFFFHSKTFGICVNKENAFYYCLILACLLNSQIVLLWQIFRKLVDDRKSNYSLNRLLGIIENGGFFLNLLSLFLFLSSCILMGTSLATFFCNGCNVAYSLEYETYKIPYGKITKRKNKKVLIPRSSLVGFCEFIRNSLPCFSKDEKLD